MPQSIRNASRRVPEGRPESIMPIAAHHRTWAVSLGAALTLSLTLTSPLLAEGDAVATKAGRAWTDPPARASTAGEAQVAVKPADTADSAPQSKMAATASKPVASRLRPMAELRPKARGWAAATRSAPRVKGRIAARQAGESQRRIRTVTIVHPPATFRGRGARMVALPPPPRDDLAPPSIVRYGYTESTVPVRVIRGFEADRARRIRQARQAGYVLIRSPEIVRPDDGGLLRMRPFERDDLDD